MIIYIYTLLNLWAGVWTDGVGYEQMMAASPGFRMVWMDGFGHPHIATVEPQVNMVYNEIYIPRRKPNWKRYDKYSVKYADLIQEHATQFNIDKYIVESIITWESNWSSKARSVANCVGLMQVMGGSTNPARNIHSGCSIYNKYRSQMKDWFLKHYNIELQPDDLIKVTLTAYNRGCGGARKYYRKHVKISNDGYEIEHSSYAKSVWWIYIQIRTELD